jgi:hypothetical protein
VAATSATREQLAALDDEERAVVLSRHDPLPSIANRLAARQAAAALALGGPGRPNWGVRGGGGERPVLWDRQTGGPAAALLSLGHEGALGIAAVLVCDDPAIPA